jgi:UDP:flavonoid glycosyltransferase YjiC (YdhE family)
MARRPRIAVLPHVGTARSHLLRAVALGRLLAPRSDVTLILPRSAQAFVAAHFPEISCEWIDWPYGHNDVLAPLLSEVVAQLTQTAVDLERILAAAGADLVIGIPGFHSSAICRALGIRHVSILHGPWLLPEVRLGSLDAGERAVVASWENAIEVTDTFFAIVTHAFGLRESGYRQWLERETVWAGQDFPGLELAAPRPCVGFLYADYGPRDRGELPEGCIAVTLGTALDGPQAGLLRVLSEMGLPLVIVGGGGGAPRRPAPDVFRVPACAGSTLARICSLAVCHGGIGTVPVFAETGVPQLFLPHDLDQAVNAVLAVRSGYGKSIDLRFWSRRTPFGRLRPAVDPDSLRGLLRELAAWRLSEPAARAPRVNDAVLVQEAVAGVLKLGLPERRTGAGDGQGAGGAVAAPGNGGRG